MFDLDDFQGHAIKIEFFHYHRWIPWPRKHTHEKYFQKIRTGRQKSRGVASTPPLGVFGWRNTLGICGLILFIHLVKYLWTLFMASIFFNKNGDHISEQYSNNGLMYILYAMVNRLSSLDTKPLNSTPSLWYALFVIILWSSSSSSMCPHRKTCNGKVQIIPIRCFRYLESISLSKGVSWKQCFWDTDPPGQTAMSSYIDFSSSCF